MATKAEVEKTNKDLKTQLKDALLRLKNLSQKDNLEQAELNEMGFSIIKIDGKFNLVELSFDSLTKAAKVDNIQEIAIDSKSISMATMAGKRYLVETILRGI